MKAFASLLLLITVIAFFGAFPGAFPAHASSELQVDGLLRKNFDFWVSIYTQYDTHQGLIHDTKYIDHVYEVIHPRRARSAKQHWREVLLSVHRKQKDPGTFTPEERKVFELYADVNEPDKFLKAAHRKRLRFQLGQKSNFLDGYRQSGKYLAEMEEIFRREGLPVELTRLPFVESSFNLKARSKVGASGIWQFMRSTAKLFIQVNEAVDERNDPIRATEAAAKLLRMNYESLGSWPLAVTAYNHGRKGVMRAVRRMGSQQLGTIVTEYHAKSFGFASGNFYMELLAAIEVERNAEKYFGKVERAQPISYVETRIPDFMDIRQLAQFMQIDLRKLKELNSGLSDAVFKGRLLIPAGYQLRLPYDGSLPKDGVVRVFLAAYEKIPELYKLRGQGPVKYGAKYGRKGRSAERL